MFTGLVQMVGRVERIEAGSKGTRLVVDTAGWKHVPSRGDSIAVNGCCLTVANAPTKARGRRGSRLRFDAVQETLDKTTVGLLASGSRVNLEHAATALTLIGGHIVQGHIDGVGRVVGVNRGSDWRVRIELPRAARGDAGLAEYVVPKGSICVDGVSLTIASVWKKGAARGFEVALIPTTLRDTTLQDLEPGDGVNIEADTIAKTVVFWMREFGGVGGFGARASRASRR